MSIAISLETPSAKLSAPNCLQEAFATVSHKSNVAKPTGNHQIQEITHTSTLPDFAFLFAFQLLALSVLPTSKQNQIEGCLGLAKLYVDVR